MEQEGKKRQVRFDKDQIIQEEYRTQQATKPQKLSCGMVKSLVVIAARLLEKMHGVSDLIDNKIESCQ